MPSRRLPGALAALLSVAAVSAEAASFDITVSFAGGLTRSQRAIFSTAESFWESKITGYAEAPGIAGPVISAEGIRIDGRGGILGQAGPTQGIGTSSYLYASAGIMQFDRADVRLLERQGSLLDVILHEMAHVLGFGTLWSSSAVGVPGYQEVYVTDSGCYTGANALAAYRAEFDSTASCVPVELDGGPGTRNGHWDETWAGGAQELMTGYLDAPTFVSDTTIASFDDIGYTTTIAPVPLPATAGMTLLALAGLGLFGLRRRTTAKG